MHFVNSVAVTISAALQPSALTRLSYSLLGVEDDLEVIDPDSKEAEHEKLEDAVAVDDVSYTPNGLPSMF